jgi:hypothetical protein
MQYYNHTARRPVGYPAGIADTPAAAVPKMSENGNDFQNPSTLPLLTGQSLGMAYVPFQRFEDLLEPDKALECGTLFRALYMPFYGQKRRPPV